MALKFVYVFLIVFISKVCFVENVLPPSYKVTSPFVAYVIYGGDHYCGGVILNNHIILTAAHCISSEMRVGVGGSYIFGNSMQFIAVQETLLHEKFRLDPNGIQAYNDVGLLRLKDPIEFNSNVQPIKWTNNIDFSKNVTIYGWGSTNAFISIPSHYLRARNTSLIPHNLCIEMLNKTITKCEKQIYELCTEKSSCNGDSGSPIVQTIGNTTRLVGILSWGADDNINCDSSPHVFTNVGYFSGWINDGVKSLLKLKELSENIIDYENIVK